MRQPITDYRSPITLSEQAGSSTVREHSADIRETAVQLRLGLLALIRHEKSRPLRPATRRVRTASELEEQQLGRSVLPGRSNRSKQGWKFEHRTKRKHPTCV